MKNIGNWLSGKKTVISSLIGLIVIFLHTRGAIDASTAELITGINAVLFGVGVGHKIKKHIDNNKNLEIKNIK